MSKKKKSKQAKNNLKLKEIRPITERQEEVFTSWINDKNLILHGSAGTGKTFVALYLALKDLDKKYRDINKIYICRSAVPTRNQGFLPGNLKEKEDIFQLPYKQICSELYSCGTAYESLRKMNKIEFVSTSYVRGITLSKCIIIADEIQNFNFHEIDSIITRLGDNSKIIFSGDYMQSDLKEKSGINKFMNIADNLKDFKSIQFSTDDIVRSDLVKEYLKTKEKYFDKNR